MQFNSSLDYSGFSPVFVKNGNETNVAEGNVTLSQLLSPPPPLPPPPPPAYFAGYTLPSGNPCEGFTFPPPPADPKRTGPRRMLLLHNLLKICFSKL